MTDLRLIDMPLAVHRALADGDVGLAEALIGVPIPPEFASKTEIWEYMITLLTDRPANAGWTMHAVAVGDVIVGYAGFIGAPNEAGEVVVGYSIETDRRRQGHAVGAVNLLLHRVAREPSVSSVLAMVNPDNAASIAVVTKAGFLRAGDRMHERMGRQLVFRRKPPDGQ